MGVYVDDVREFTRPPDAEGDEERLPLGQRLRGVADEIDVDSVESVWELRERR